MPSRTLFLTLCFHSFSVPLDLHVCLLCRRLNTGNGARLSAGGFNATVKNNWSEKKMKQGQSLWLFGHKAACTRNSCASQYLSLSVITRANVMQVLAIAVCILEVKKKSPCVKGENKYFSCSANVVCLVSHGRWLWSVEIHLVLRSNTFCSSVHTTALHHEAQNYRLWPLTAKVVIAWKVDGGKVYRMKFWCVLRPWVV